MTTPKDHLTLHNQAAPMRAERSGPLLGIRVLDLTHAIAGPYCSMMLADLGADVIKIEPPNGDLQRPMGPYTREDSERAYGGTFAAYNRNKRGIVLDFKLDADRERFFELVDTADVVVENQRAGVLDSQGIGWEVLHARNPRLVYGAVRGFGDPRTGQSPYVDWPAYDVVAQAMSGFVSMNGAAAGEEVKAGPFIGDIYPGTVAAVGVLAAVLHAKMTGEGQFVDVSMVDAMISLSEMGVVRQSYMGRPTPPTGNQAESACPFGIFPTKDGSCAIAAPTEKAWRQLAELIGRADLADDERANTLALRVRNRDMVEGALVAWSTQHTNAEVLAVLGGKVPCGPVNSPLDLFDDPHVAAREMLVSVDQTEGRPVVLVNTPLRFTATPVGIYRRPPRKGEHNDEIFGSVDQ